MVFSFKKLIMSDISIYCGSILDSTKNKRTWNEVLTATKELIFAHHRCPTEVI